MDIRNLLERIREVKDSLERANRIINICGNECRSSGILADGRNGECYLKVDSSEIKELAESQKVHLESELERLVEAKNTADRVVAGLLPEIKQNA
ncbi:TPA: hypothetical protein ACR599_005369 [Klebsiella variicola]|uniref:hypothetical protein n=1 Tax=Klebsiella/Raoultella group TaxID=2890311 RepID=UPI001C21220A|nr:hypothetical protein [Klebsiella sp. PL-2018]EKP1129396.1 hypothetical protein [Klebsiella michiganensis]MDM9674039.1 hypothetical protein [Raoultella planticola]QXC97393.1 hypothetical protein MKleb_1893 [Klebsiella sp. PL-2018]HBM3162326.1 hypothetical protein [Klebsiella michiganensis]HCT8861390.1 hypothetical protein [Klebsiella michiganensis]